LSRSLAGFGIGAMLLAFARTHESLARSGNEPNAPRFARCSLSLSEAPSCFSSALSVGDFSI
jgi:hypothetical protein